jgi:long-subunit fatty acid transport protein
MKRRSLLISVLVLFAATEQAKASTDINGLFDARSHALGGSGVAYLDSAGAIPANPALLDQIPKLALSLDIYYIRSQPESPYTIYHIDPATGQQYRNYETIRSPTTGAPLPFFGVAYRLLDRVVVGAAVYPVIGQGAQATYKPAPDQYPNAVAKVDVAMGLIEAGIPISVRLLDNLSLGLMWRMTYMTQSVSTPLPATRPPGAVINTTTSEVINADINVTGMNFTGLQVGLFYKPAPSLRLGFSYRSKVTVDGSGTTTTKIGPMATVLDTTQGYSNPHAFRAGLAWTTLQDKLMLVADLKYLLYAEAFKTVGTTTMQPGKPPSTASTPAYWKNSVSVHAGAEYRVADGWLARLGGAIVTSATNADYALSYFAPPGNAYQVMGGLGIKILDSLNMDIAAGYVVLASKVEGTQYNAGTGIYGSHSFFASESITFHL